MRRPFAALLVAFALVVIAFFASTLYSQYASRGVDRSAQHIANNAMPSIQHLGTARAELRQLETQLHTYLDSPTGLRAIEDTQRRLDAAIDAYMILPNQPEEQVLWHDLRRDLSRVDHFVIELKNTPTRSPANLELHRELRDAVDRAAGTLNTLEEINARQGLRDAARIRKARYRSDQIALGLDGLCVLLTVLVAFLALRTLRQYARVLEERNRLEMLRAEELENFAGRVAHDVLGPLSATSMALQLALRAAPSDQTREVLERGSRGVRRVQTIVDGLLRFARAGARPEPGVRTQVAPLVEEVLAELGPVAVEARVELRADQVVDAEVACNPGVLTSLLENLVRNAIKYMQDAPTRLITVAVAARGDTVRFEVVDTGPGITPELLPRIFEPYVRGRNTARPGIGLGLATVRRMVEAHGGMVGVESSPRGSRFWFELPRVAGATSEAEPTTSALH